MMATTSAGDGAADHFAHLITILASAQGALCAVHREASRLGLERGALYVSGAQGNLRIATASVLANAARAVAMPTLEGIHRLDDTAFALRASGDRMIGDRVRVTLERDGNATVTYAPEQDDEPSPPMRNLMVDLMASQHLRELAAGPVFAGLLAHALGHHDWWCAGAGARWSADPSAAAAIVDALSLGRWRVSLGIGDAGGLIDRQVADQLAAVGWYPLGELEADT